MVARTERKKILLIATAAAVLVTGAAIARYATLKTWGLRCDELNEELESLSNPTTGLLIKENFSGGFTAWFRDSGNLAEIETSRDLITWETSNRSFWIRRFPHRKHNGLYAYRLTRMSSDYTQTYECVSVSPSLG